MTPCMPGPLRDMWLRHADVLETCSDGRTKTALSKARRTNVCNAGAVQRKTSAAEARNKVPEDLKTLKLCRLSQYTQCLVGALC